MNYLNNISTKTIVDIKRNPIRYIDQDNFGERVQEKKIIFYMHQEIKNHITN